MINIYENEAILPVSKANAIVERILNESDGAYNDEYARQQFTETIISFLKQSIHPGDADDFHNFAVTLAIKDEYLLACDILECGLKYFPRNVDLLADYLAYGLSCNKQEECKKYYDILISIPKQLWTWRGFTFSITYLITYKKDKLSSQKEIDEFLAELLNIVTNYRNKYPETEESYRSEAFIYKELGMPEKQILVLENAMRDVLSCPKCALTYSNLLFERGEYEKALSGISRALSDSTQMQKNYSDENFQGYLYLTSALCKIALAQKNNSFLSEEEVLDIYSDLNIALPYFNNSNTTYKANIKTEMLYLLGKYNIDVPTNYSYLYEYVQQL